MGRFIWKTRGPTGFPPGCLVWEFIRPVPKAGPLLVAGLSPSLKILPISIFAAWSETLPLCRGSPASAILFNQSPRVPPPVLIVPSSARGPAQGSLLPFRPEFGIKELLTTTLGSERSNTSTSLAAGQVVGRPSSTGKRRFAALKPSRPAQCKPPPVCVNIRGRRLAAAGNRLHLSNGNAGGWGMEQSLGYVEGSFCRRTKESFWGFSGSMDRA